VIKAVKRTVINTEKLLLHPCRTVWWFSQLNAVYHIRVALVELVYVNDTLYTVQHHYFNIVLYWLVRMQSH